MDSTQLQKSHKHLSLVFTGMIFCIIFIIASSFLFARYFNENRIQKNSMRAQIMQIYEEAKRDPDYFQKILSGNTFGENRKLDLRGRDIGSLRGRTSFFVLDREDNIVYEQQFEEPKFSRLDFSSRGIYRDGQSFVFTRKIGAYSVIFYQNIRYSSDDVLRDFILLFFVTLIISGGIYFIGYRFTGKILKPVEENIHSMSEFTHNAGHELKTPLAVVRGNLQIMQSEEKIDAKLLKKSISQIDDMSSLIDGLRELSEVGKISETHLINVPYEIKKLVKTLEPLAYKHGIHIHGKFPEKFMLSANKEEFDICISNIIKNAILYTEKGGRVDISMHKNILKISDTGIGMSSEEIEKIFDRLYRVQKARNTSGKGIGLSLSKKIADANNWKIELESKKGKGTEFRVIF